VDAAHDLLLDVRRAAGAREDQRVAVAKAVREL
jgi:hypothetical protein